MNVKRLMIKRVFRIEPPLADGDSSAEFLDNLLQSREDFVSAEILQPDQVMVRVQEMSISLPDLEPDPTSDELILAEATDKIIDYLLHCGRRTEEGIDFGTWWGGLTPNGGDAVKRGISAEIKRTVFDLQEK